MMAIRLPTVLHDETGPHSCWTEDVGPRGIFVQTDDSKPLRQLIRLELNLPEGDFVLQGIVIHEVTVEDAARLDAVPDLPG